MRGSTPKNSMIRKRMISPRPPSPPRRAPRDIGIPRGRGNPRPTVSPRRSSMFSLLRPSCQRMAPSLKFPMIPASWLRRIHSEHWCTQRTTLASDRDRGPGGAGFASIGPPPRIANASCCGPPAHPNSTCAPSVLSSPLRGSGARRFVVEAPGQSAAVAQQLHRLGHDGSRARAPGIMPRSGLSAPALWLKGCRPGGGPGRWRSAKRVALSAPAGGHGQRACLAKRRLRQAPLPDDRARAGPPRAAEISRDPFLSPATRAGTRSPAPGQRSPPGPIFKSRRRCRAPGPCAPCRSPLGGVGSWRARSRYQDRP